MNTFPLTALFKVRAAAVFALGRFIANTGDRSDQANQIDFGVAMTLTQLSQDGSPLVRKVYTCICGSMLLLIQFCTFLCSGVW